MDWNSKVAAPGVTTASLQTSVISTSVIAGSTMSTNPGPGGDARVPNLDNHSPGHSEDLSDPNFSQYGQSSGLPPMPLFNGVGSSYPSGGFGNGGDSLPSMWSPSVETPNSEEIHESGMWNWSK
ncbi:uncharacterized protein LOC132745119 isoform X2 [Ruditapes philippinarum]|uniref:uncharacterized protein LOC132745119 isoform X2 n=1 Tax=Ruditapes philippinarum TaxID=129788 RepID=UPI00295A8AC4|nr:uncharacterized protein LOC132745119 isoform X2 [Ruditapes philippinarum]